MKLTKAQVSALASKIIVEINEPIIAHNKAIRESKQFLQFYERKDIQKIIQVSWKYGLDTSDYLVNNFIEKLKKSFFEDKLKKTFNGSKIAIENEIIIKTIESDSIDELIQSIKEKYA